MSIVMSRTEEIDKNLTLYEIYVSKSDLLCAYSGKEIPASAMADMLDSTKKLQCESWELMNMHKIYTVPIYRFVCKSKSKFTGYRVNEIVYDVLHQLQQEYHAGENAN